MNVKGDPPTSLATKASLDAAASRLHSAEPFAASLTFALAEIRAALRAEAASVAVRAPGGAELVFLASSGAGAEHVAGRRIPAGEGIVARVLETGTTDITLDASRDPRHAPLLDHLTRSSTRSMVTAALKPGGHLLGTLQVLNPIGRGPFGEADGELAAGFADLVASAIVQRGEHRHYGVAPAALGELEFRRRLVAWAEASGAFLRALLEAGRSGEPLLIRGEPGSGREAAARALHAWRLGTAPPASGGDADASRFVLVTATGTEPQASLAEFESRGGVLFVTGLESPRAFAEPGFLDQLRRLAARERPRVFVMASAPARPLPPELEALFAGRVVEAPPLRARLSDLQAWAGELVRTLREPLRSPTLGFEPAALAALAAEPFERNLDGLRSRVAAILLGSTSTWIGTGELAEHGIGPDAGGAPGARRGGVADIFRRLDDPRPRVRAEALRRLEEGAAAGHPELAARLVERLAEDHEWLRARVIRLLGGLADRRAVRPLIELLGQAADPALRREILAALGRLRSGAALDPLLRHLRDRDPDVRATVLLSLVRIGGEGARRAVEGLLDDPDPRVRCTAHGALYHFETGHAVSGEFAAEPGAPAVDMLARIAVVEDGVERERRELGDEPVSIGRTHQTDVVLADPRVSKNHAAIEKVGREWVIRDSGSTNGTKVNGERITEKVLVDGDQVEIGGFILVFAEEPAPPSPEAAAGLDDLEATLFRTLPPGTLLAASGIRRPGPGAPRAARAAPARPARGAAASPARDAAASPAVSRLIQETQSEDADARRWAARVLGDVGHGTVRLVEMLDSDPDPEVRVEAARALGASRDLQAVQPLLGRLDDRLLRFVAIEALGALRAPEAVDPLVTLLESERNSRLRRAALRSLGLIAHPRSVPALAAALEVPTLAASAVDALVRVGGDAAGAALARHLDPTDPLCAEAASGLGALRAASAVPRLVELLDAGDGLVAARAVQALAAIGPPATGPLMTALESPARRSAAIAALAELREPAAASVLLAHAEASPEAREALRRLGVRALPALISGFEAHPAAASRILATVAEAADDGAISGIADLLAGDAPAIHVEPLLAAIGERAVDPLRRLLREAKEPDRRARAMSALAGIGSPRALPEILEAMPDSGEAGRQAVRAAGRIPDPELAAEVAARFASLPVRQRVAAVEVLARAPWRAAGPPLAPALGDPDPGVRCAAVMATGDIAAHDARPILEQFLANDPDPLVRALAAARARDIGLVGVDELAARIRDPARPKEERDHLALALVELPGAGALDAALGLVADGEATATVGPAVRSAVVDGLARRGTELLVRLAARPDGEVLGQDPVLLQVWTRLAFRPEFAAQAIAALIERDGDLGRRLRDHLQAWQAQAVPFLVDRLAAGPEPRERALLLEALLAVKAPERGPSRRDHKSGSRHEGEET